MKHLLISILLFSVGTTALAQRASRSSNESSFTSNEFVLNLNFFYIGDSQNLSLSRKRFDFLYQAMAGYRYNNWLFGAQYDYDKEENKFTDVNGTITYSWERVSYGPVIGYFFDPFYAYATYYINPTLKTSISGASETRYNGNFGYALTVGYNYRYNANIGLGLMLTYRAFDFDQSTSAGTTSPVDDYNTSSLDPMASFFVYF